MRRDQALRPVDHGDHENSKPTDQQHAQEHCAGPGEEPSELARCFGCQACDHHQCQASKARSPQDDSSRYRPSTVLAQAVPVPCRFARPPRVTPDLNCTPCCICCKSHAEQADQCAPEPPHDEIVATARTYLPSSASTLTSSPPRPWRWGSSSSSPPRPGDARSPALTWCGWFALRDRAPSQRHRAPGRTQHPEGSVVHGRAASTTPTLPCHARSGRGSTSACRGR